MAGASYAALPSVPSGQLALKEDKSAKGAASGYAPLDSGSLVPAANLPNGAVTAADATLIHYGAKATTGPLATVALPYAGTETLVLPGMTSKTVTQMGGAAGIVAYIAANSSCTATLVGTTLTIFAAAYGTALNGSTVTGTLLSVTGALDHGANPEASLANAEKLDALSSTRMGVALTDADTTVQPFTDKVSKYSAAAASRTGNRTKTLGIASAYTGKWVEIEDRDLSANTLTVANAGTAGGNLGVFPTSHTNPMSMLCYYDGVNWLFNGFVDLVA